MAAKPGLAAMIVSKMAPKKGGADGGEPDGDENYDGKMACVEDMMSAMDQKDPEAFKKALESFLDHR